ncbi:MAG: permease [Burkholderiales bacterium]
MQRILSFEQSPPLSVPMRFFLTAPVFAAVAGCIVFWYGPQALDSRWSPITLALTHLLTLGFVTMSMVGALLQLLHVVAGVEVPYVRFTAGLVHVLLVIGTIVFVAAFLSSEPVMFRIALFILLAAFTWLVGASMYGLLGVEVNSATLRAIFLSLLGLGFAAALGVTLACVFGWGVALPFMLLGDLHVAWGLLGWVGLLVIGVAYQVVPMFQVTPLYPPFVTKILAPVLFLLLCLWSVAATIVLPVMFNWLPTMLSTLLAAGYMIFSVMTIHLLWQRKRKTTDTTTLFWLTGLISLLGGAGLWLMGTIIPGIREAPSYPLALGILFLVGFAYSTINGMLYKIVPFLVWYHLQNQMAEASMKAGMKVPNVRQIIADRMTRNQFFMHLAALVLLVGATVWPDRIARPAAVALVASSMWLWLNLANATRIYRNRLNSNGNLLQEKTITV